MAMRFVDIQSIADNAGVGSGGTPSNQPIVVEQSTPALSWLIPSVFAYSQPTIMVKQIGERILPKPKIVLADWEYLESGTKISIKFAPSPCSGFVILHKN